MSRRRSPASIALFIGFSAAGLGALFVGCDAGGGAGGTAFDETNGPGPGAGGASGTGGADGNGGDTAGPSTSAITVTVANSAAVTSTGSGQNPCGTECGEVELCDGANEGLDNNCDGTVDEGCPCSPGQANDCFKGDPSYRESEGCFPGTMRCTEFGQWGTCDGGAHAFGDEPCQEGSLEGCHAITAVPFQVVNLKSGTGVFSEDADAGSESWTVECPEGVSPCPEVNGTNPPDDFQPLQSGEYIVTYNKMVDGQPETCSYPLNVGARGLRVEITWNYGAQTDLDLHMLQPGVLGPMDRGGTATDCAWDNCVANDFASNSGPEWFPQNAPVGDPIAWYLDPVEELNSCYFAPRGVGQTWRALGRGCHNPRLDLDNISCDTSATDVNDSDFCAPENVNIDFPPQNQWTRVGVVHYSGAPQQLTMKIFCDGALKAVLGPEGYSTPVNLSSSGVWLAADVAFVEDECSSECIVSPIFQDPNAMTPFITSSPATGPAFPPLP